jgi:hypothetical protein
LSTTGGLSVGQPSGSNGSQVLASVPLGLRDQFVTSGQDSGHARAKLVESVVKFPRLGLATFPAFQRVKPRLLTNIGSHTDTASEAT